MDSQDEKSTGCSSTTMMKYSNLANTEILKSREPKGLQQDNATNVVAGSSMLHCTSCNVSQYKNRVYVQDKHYRRRYKHKPYDPCDVLNFDTLQISPVKETIRLPVVQAVNKDLSQTLSKVKVPILHPPKLKTSHSNVFTKLSSPTKEISSFDFASLAAQVSELERKTVSKTMNTTSFKFSKVRRSVDNLPKFNAFLECSSDEDENDELDALRDSLTQVCPQSTNTDVSAPALRASPRSAVSGLVRSCSQEAMLNENDFSAEELAYYFDELVHIPKKMSEMAEMMYT